VVYPLPPVDTCPHPHRTLECTQIWAMWPHQCTSSSQHSCNQAQVSKGFVYFYVLLSLLLVLLCLLFRYCWCLAQKRGPTWTFTLSTWTSH
jgi:hypothetical protein